MMYVALAIGALDFIAGVGAGIHIAVTDRRNSYVASIYFTLMGCMGLLADIFMISGLSTMKR